MLKVKHERTCDCVVAGYRMHKDGNGLGSLLLGLYDDDGVLHHVGVGERDGGAAAQASCSKTCSRCARTRSKGIRGATGPNAMHEAAESGQRMPGGPNRWNATKDMSWEPLRIERVAEVEYEGLLSGRFRHNARFRRWRDDRDPDRLHLLAARVGRAGRAARDVRRLRRVRGPGVRRSDDARPSRRTPQSDIPAR